MDESSSEQRKEPFEPCVQINKGEKSPGKQKNEPLKKISKVVAMSAQGSG